MQLLTQQLTEEVSKNLEVKTRVDCYWFLTVILNYPQGPWPDTKEFKGMHDGSISRMPGSALPCPLLQAAACLTALLWL